MIPSCCSAPTGHSWSAGPSSGLPAAKEVGTKQLQIQGRATDLTGIEAPGKAEAGWVFQAGEGAWMSHQQSECWGAERGEEMEQTILGSAQVS